ncbi:MAG: DUF2310 family Zn-ribbon-containing protein [Chlorobi bacterium]|nr:DUF2310 family Zn-ribbon-containing protein [Chlorobiota bacterium]
MIDKPVAAKILLTLENPKKDGKVFIGLQNTLYCENLIFSEPREIRINKKVLELIVIFRDVKSFEQWENHPAINQHWNLHFKQLLTKNPITIEEFDFFIEYDESENCTCENSSFYILFGRDLDMCKELICADCLKQVSYSKIPKEIEIEDWQRKRQRVYLNWLESGLFEQEAFDELINYSTGKLNIEGEKIRKKLSDFFHIPVYIHLFEEEEGVNHDCLMCGSSGEDSGLGSPRKICKKCNTIYDFYYDDIE